MVTKFSLATNERYKDKAGEWVDKTEWHNVVAWAKLAEIAEKYVKKGHQLFVEGQIQTRSWDKDGVKHYMTEINAKDLILLGGKGGHDEPRAEVVDTAVKPIDDSGIPF